MTGSMILNVIVGLLVLGSGPSVAAPLLSFPLSADQRGTVACLENPSINYDIYLPPAYSRTGNPLPILYTFEATGGGQVAKFKTVCTALNIIVVGVKGSKNNLGWDIVFKECYAISRDIRTRVLYDPTAEFAAGMSGGGLVSYMYARIRAQHVAGVFPMGAWLGRGGGPESYQTIDRVPSNLLIARAMGNSDGSQRMTPDANYLSQWIPVIKDWYFDGGHVIAPDSVKTSALQWLVAQRTAAAPNDRADAAAQAEGWRASLGAGRREEVARECVSVLMGRPRSWFAHEAQLMMDDLLADNANFRTLSLSNLAQGDYASDFFYYHAYGAGINSDRARYNSCMQALTGISGTNGDRAGDVFTLLQRFGYPAPKPGLLVDKKAGTATLSLEKTAPGLAYTHQTSATLLGGAWRDLGGSVVESGTSWSASFDVDPALKSSFYRVGTSAIPALSPPWPIQ